MQRLALIDAAHAPGDTVMRHVTGRGPHGMVSGSVEFSGFGANAHGIVFCEPTVLSALRLGLKPILDCDGGVGFVPAAEPF